MNDRSIARKPFYSDIDMTIVCPNCHSDIIIHLGRERELELEDDVCFCYYQPKYCPECGQKIDWN